MVIYCYLCKTGNKKTSNLQLLITLAVMVFTIPESMPVNLTLKHWKLNQNSDMLHDPCVFNNIFTVTLPSWQYFNKTLVETNHSSSFMSHISWFCSFTFNQHIEMVVLLLNLYVRNATISTFRIQSVLESLKKHCFFYHCHVLMYINQVVPVAWCLLTSLCSLF